MTDHQQLFFKPGVSPTSINQFFESPSRFWKYSSLNPNRERKEPTPAMIFGRLVHCLVLTPEVFEKEFAIAPVKKGEIDTIDEAKAVLAEFGLKVPGKPKRIDFMNAIRANAPNVVLWDDVMANFTASAGRKTIVSTEQMTEAKSMQDAMLANRGVRNLIGNGMSESPFCWWPDATPENPEAGIMRKVRLDYVRSGLVIEYKTTLCPDDDDFSRDIGNMGYHRQLATQVVAATMLNGEAPRGAIIIAQDKEMHDDISIVAVGSSDITIGDAENQYAMNEIKRRMALMNEGVSEKDAWKKFSDEIRAISLPKWYKSKAR